jgi:hypothetical protein
MNKPKIFVVTKTPKGLDNILDVQPEHAGQHYCAVINVSDSQCATFDYQRAGLPSFWFPINEIGKWGHSPFLGALRVVNEYYKEGDKPVLIHCHAGANRSPSIAYAILLAKGYTAEEAELSLQYDGLSQVFLRNVQRKHIPENIVEFLKLADKHPELSLSWCLRKMDSLYEEWAHKKFDEQNDYTVEAEDGNPVRLVYNKEKKKFILVKEEESKKESMTTPWVEPKFQRQEWYVTPIVSETKETT